MLAALTQQPELLKNALLENFRIDERPLTYADVHALILSSNKALLDSFEAKFNEFAVRIPQPEAAAVVEPQQELEDPIPPGAVPMGNSRFIWFQYDGRFWRVPRGFEFKDMPLASVWPLWFNGNSRRRICPYLNFRSTDLGNAKTTSYNNHQKAKKVINALVQRAVDMQLIVSRNDLEGMCNVDLMNIFDLVFPPFIDSIYGADKTHASSRTLLFCTVANKMYDKASAVKRHYNCDNRPKTHQHI
jgi:hypothetical protein